MLLLPFYYYYYLLMCLEGENLTHPFGPTRNLGQILSRCCQQHFGVSISVRQHTAKGVGSPSFRTGCSKGESCRSTPGVPGCPGATVPGCMGQLRWLCHSGQWQRHTTGRYRLGALSYPPISEQWRPWWLPEPQTLRSTPCASRCSALPL